MKGRKRHWQIHDSENPLQHIHDLDAPSYLLKVDEARISGQYMTDWSQEFEAKEHTK